MWTHSSSSQTIEFHCANTHLCFQLGQTIILLLHIRVSRGSIDHYGHQLTPSPPSQAWPTSGTCPPSMVAHVTPPGLTWSRFQPISGGFQAVWGPHRGCSQPSQGTQGAWKRTPDEQVGPAPSFRAGALQAGFLSQAPLGAGSWWSGSPSRPQSTPEFPGILLSTCTV